METLKMIEKEKGEAIFVKTDVSSAEDIDNMVKKCTDKYGRIDILVNNAGIVRYGSIHEFNEKD